MSEFALTACGLQICRSLGETENGSRLSSEAQLLRLEEEMSSKVNSCFMTIRGTSHQSLRARDH